MTSGKYLRLVVGSALRNPSHFALSAFGIVVGTAAFVFFLALSAGVKQWILGDWFPIDRVEVIAPRTALLGVSMQKPLDDEVVDLMRDHPGVVEVVPRMAMGFPVMGIGSFEGHDLRLELVGDGVDPGFVEERFHDRFRDWDAAEADQDLPACGPPPRHACDRSRYCDRRSLQCRRKVPMLVSRNLVEIYNTQFAESRGMPVIGAVEEAIAERGILERLRLEMHLGSSMVELTRKNLSDEPRVVEAVLVGLSDRAIPIGVTVPIQYVERWNREYLGAEATRVYSSIVVTLESPDDVARFGNWVMAELDLRLADSVGEQLAGVILLVTLLFVLIALVIVTIAAINIAHNFFMQVSERRREIGVFRALGATQANVRAIILGEAALIGVVSGLLGIGLSVAASLIADPVLSRGNLPFQPESFFDFEWWILAGGLGFAVIFCVLGGFLPARKAARMQPAQALAQQ
jgi:putative ABC transport system permease protein